MADRYWVGGSGTWNSTAGTKWATTSGGVGGASVPSSSDDVYFDASSGSVLVVVDVAGFKYARNLIFNGFTGTFSSTTSSGSGLNISGNLDFTGAPGMAFNYNSGLTFQPVTNTTSYITSAGKLIGNNNLTVQSSGGATTTVQINDSCSFKTLTLTQGILNINNNLIVCQKIFSSNDFQRSIIFGSGVIELAPVTSAQVIIDMLNVTNFTYTTSGLCFRTFSSLYSVIRYGSGAGGNAANAANISIYGGSAQLDILTGSHIKNLILTGSSCPVNAIYNAYGNLTLGSWPTYASVQPTFLASATITPNGGTLGSTTINGAGAVVTLAGAFATNAALTLTQGTFDAVTFAVTAQNFVSSNTNTRTLNMGTAIWAIGAGSATPWDISVSSGLTLNPGTSTINMAGGIAKTFAGGGLTYYRIRQGGSGALTINGSNTFNDIDNTFTLSTITFEAGTTQTVSNFNLAGAAGNLVIINSSVPGSQFTLSKASGTVTAQYLAIQDSNATGGATWNASSPTNTNLGNNTGWIFASGNAFMQFF